MVSLLQPAVTTAAGISGISFIIIVSTFPFIINEIGSIEEELALQMDEYSKLSNFMWKDLMKEKIIARAERAADQC